EWTPQNEIEYSEFVRKIGESSCASTMDCLRIKENPFRETDSPTWTVRTDCAKFPYLLRAYFAWKKGLPFSHVSQVVAVGQSKDLRYSPKGNIPVRRRDAVGTSRMKVNGERFLTSLIGQVSTAMFRIAPDAAGTITASSVIPVLSDFYSPELTRENLVPGTMLYDPAGHVAVIYKIEDDGRILTLDAHPDDSVTRGQFAKRFPRSTPAHGAGFKRWRPQTLVGSVADTTRGFLGGQIVVSENTKIAGFGLEQYASGDLFQFGGQDLDYFYYVRAKLTRGGQFILDPLRETQSMLQALCQDLKDRVHSVEVAVKNGIPLKPHPPRLPTNIFGADGEWEEYSTPARDTRLRQNFKDLRDQVALFLKLNAQNPGLRAELRGIYEAEDQTCVLGYQKTNGVEQLLTISGVLDRIFEVDFSPYQCTERRWGANSAQELASCPVDAEKTRWYQATQPLRNSLDRNPTAFHGYTLEEILGGKAQFGVNRRPDVDVRTLLFDKPAPLKKLR
ncbi:MAG: hypothetical protein K2X47_20185, partial [Bdellovibrionales bacterium]|nr:hypothetical protein [Bdellovibrionales bacterium]